MNGALQIEVMQARIQSCATLPDTLTAGFDAFETIRLHARQCEGRAPELFAAFMTTAAAAADGCDAIAAAPSLPPSDRHTVATSMPVLDADIDEIADALAALATALHSVLARAATTAANRADRTACEDAAGSAMEIRHLMARTDDDAHLR